MHARSLPHVLVRVLGIVLAVATFAVFLTVGLAVVLALLAVFGLWLVYRMVAVHLERRGASARVSSAGVIEGEYEVIATRRVARGDDGDAQ